MAMDDRGTERMLEIGVQELHRLYDFISTTYDGLRTKALALTAGEVAIVTFLFSAENEHKKALSEQAVSYLILYFIGVLLLAGAFLIFLWIIAPSQWDCPPDTSDLEDMKDRFDNNEEKFLVYLKGRYVSAIRSSNRTVSRKSKVFVVAVLCLAVGIFLLALLKFGGGTIAI